MQNYKYLIIGGGAAGTSAAEAIRKEDPQGSIAIVSDEVHPLYSRVMLSKPNFFLGKIPFDQIYLKGQEWYGQNKITFLGGRTATALDVQNKIVSLDNREQAGYDQLLIATGVRTRAWDVPGSDKGNIHSLRTLEDGQKIIGAIKETKKAVIVGGSFIGFEMADLMQMAGLEATMILRENYIWEPTLDEPSGRMIEEALQKMGVKILKNMEVAEVLGGQKVSAVKLKDGNQIDCDIIITGIGVVPPSLDFLKKAGVEVQNAILTDEYLETNVEGVWAAGDIAEYKDLLLEENIQLGNWVNAREQGRIAGLNMVASLDPAKAKLPFKFVSFYTTQGVGTSIAFVGDARPLPDREIIARGSPESGSYERILLVRPSPDSERKELVGATMINRTSELSTVAKLIENNVDVSSCLPQLSEPNFDLKQLLPNG
jgi:NAD(P)H-nitrite reductase large subunit